MLETIKICKFLLSLLKRCQRFFGISENREFFSEKEVIGDTN
jgi:hypothetical protein